MWIFTTSGFISAVSNSDGTLKVRARDKASLKGLANTFKVEIEHTPVADYPYRVVVGHDQFAEWVDFQARAIDYNNFKSAVALTRGKGFASALSEVWSTMHDVEDSDARERSIK
jgi:hypothetical protein